MIDSGDCRNNTDENRIYFGEIIEVNRNGFLVQKRELGTKSKHQQVVIPLCESGIPQNSQFVSTIVGKYVPFVESDDYDDEQRPFGSCYEVVRQKLCNLPQLNIADLQIGNHYTGIISGFSDAAVSVTVGGNTIDLPFNLFHFPDRIPPYVFLNLSDEIDLIIDHVDEQHHSFSATIHSIGAQNEYIPPLIDCFDADMGKASAEETISIAGGAQQRNICCVYKGDVLFAFVSINVLHRFILIQKTKDNFRDAIHIDYSGKRFNPTVCKEYQTISIAA